MMVIQLAIFHGDPDANSNSGVKTNIPTIESCIDMRAAADKIREDCALRPNILRTIAVRMMVERDEASGTGLSDGVDDDVVAWIVFQGGLNGNADS